MSVLSHLDSLKKRHYAVELELEKAYSLHHSDEELQKLKKMKLRLKDEIAIFAEMNNQNIVQLQNQAA